jgi:hypothetical protein
VEDFINKGCVKTVPSSLSLSPPSLLPIKQMLEFESLSEFALQSTCECKILGSYFLLPETWFCLLAEHPA